MPKLYADTRRKRSRLETYIDTLQVIKLGVRKPTRIMYAANLSWVPLVKVLNSLTAQALIKENDEGKKARYEITEKGNRVLRYFNKASELMVVAR